MLIRFNNGENPKSLHQLELDGQILNYKQKTKFLGVYLTTKLEVTYWHFNHKSQKKTNFLKNSSQPWCQDRKRWLDLNVTWPLYFVSQIKLIYCQEVCVSAPITLLKKLQSINSKTMKLAIGVPVHTNTIKTYTAAGMISLSEQRKLAVSKYVIRSLSVIE